MINMTNGEVPQITQTRAPAFAPSLALAENLAIFMLSPQGIIEQIEHDLKGEILSSDGKFWVKTGIRTINDRGIAEIKSTLTAFINPNIFLSIFTKEEIYRNCSDLEYELNSLFYLKWKEFDIKKEHLNILKRKIMVQVHASLSRALEFNKQYGGSFGMFLQALTQTIEQRTIIASGDTKRGFSIFGRGKKEQVR